MKAISTTKLRESVFIGLKIKGATYNNICCPLIWGVQKNNYLEKESHICYNLECIVLSIALLEYTPSTHIKMSVRTMRGVMYVSKKGYDGYVGVLPASFTRKRSWKI